MNKKVKAELLFAFSQMYEDVLMAVPQKLKEEVVIDFDKEVFDSFDSEIPFTEQEMSEEALEILEKIFKDKNF